MLRYIGNKEKISSIIIEKMNLNNDDIIFDCFSGVGGMTTKFNSENITITNDYMYYAHCINEALNSNVNLDLVEEILLDMKKLKAKVGFITQYYSPYKDNRRMYFSVENAMLIDTYRLYIRRLYKDHKINIKEKKFLIAILLESVSKVANVAGVYGSYLKKWDPRALKPLDLYIPDKYKTKKKISEQSKNYNENINDIIKDVECDIIYIDPPYTKNQYTSQYHIIETIARYDNPRITGITGTRTDKVMSNYSKKNLMLIDLMQLLLHTKAKKAYLSYNNLGLVALPELETYIGLLDKNFKKHIIEYSNYKNSRTVERNSFEVLYEIRLDNIILKSPLNYSGGKYSILTFINESFNLSDTNYFIDVFGGGMNVAINSNSNNIIYNDINTHVTDLIIYFKYNNLQSILKNIEHIIDKYKPMNKDGFNELRTNYNKSCKKDELKLYVLIIYGFNQQLRFNSKGEFNNTFHGKVGFNNTIKARLILFIIQLQKKNITILNKQFEYIINKYKKYDDVKFYFDPPYYITCASYNDGKRLYGGWSEKNEIILYNQLENLINLKIKFALSNVLEHKGFINEYLHIFLTKNSFIQLKKIKHFRREEILLCYMGGE